MNQKGAAYEEQAAGLLAAKGYRIVERNWACRMGELDIVAEKNGVLVFVEVRARSNPGYGSPAESITPSKKVKIIRAAMAYIKARRPEAEEYRFDIVGIVPGSEPEHIEGAFTADGAGYF